VNGHTSNNELLAALKSRYQSAQKHRDRNMNAPSLSDYWQGHMDVCADLGISLEVVDSREDLADKEV
jgi:hypothetical protein